MRSRSIGVKGYVDENMAELWCSVRNEGHTLPDYIELQVHDDNNGPNLRRATWLTGDLWPTHYFLVRQTITEMVNDNRLCSQWGNRITHCNVRNIVAEAMVTQYIHDVGTALIGEGARIGGLYGPRTGRAQHEAQDEDFKVQLIKSCVPEALLNHDLQCHVAAHLDFPISEDKDLREQVMRRLKTKMTPETWVGKGFDNCVAEGIQRLHRTLPTTMSVDTRLAGLPVCRPMQLGEHQWRATDEEMTVCEIEFLINAWTEWAEEAIFHELLDWASNFQRRFNHVRLCEV